MMKKAFIFVSILSFVSLPFLFAEENTAQENPTTAQITYIEGTVVANLSGDTWVPAEKGMALGENASVKTGDQSYCDLTLDKDMKNVISIGPNSEVKVGKALSQIHISKGRVFSQLKGLAPGSVFEVVTPQAVAGVRGTAWESIVDEVAKFNVKEHTVYVKGKDKKGAMATTDVAQGFSVAVDASGWLGELKELTKEDEERMANWSSRIERTLQGTSGKSNCKDMIDDFQGGTANLFGQVIDCETGGGDASFAGAEGTVIVRSDFEQGIGGDITNTSFLESPESPESPEPTPEPPAPPIPAGPPKH